jgi:hypothetical protein
MFKSTRRSYCPERPQTGLKPWRSLRSCVTNCRKLGYVLGQPSAFLYSVPPSLGPLLRHWWSANVQAGVGNRRSVILLPAPSRRLLATVLLLGLEAVLVFVLLSDGASAPRPSRPWLAARNSQLFDALLLLCACFSGHRERPDLPYKPVELGVASRNVLALLARVIGLDDQGIRLCCAIARLAQAVVEELGDEGEEGRQLDAEGCFRVHSVDAVSNPVSSRSRPDEQGHRTC